LAGEVTEAASWQLHGSHPRSRHSPLHTPQLSPPAQPRHSHGTAPAQRRHSSNAVKGSTPALPQILALTPPQHRPSHRHHPPSSAPSGYLAPCFKHPAGPSATGSGEGGIRSGVVDEERYRAGKSAEGDWGPGMGTLRAVPCAEEAGQNGNKSGCGDARLPFVSASA